MGLQKVLVNQVWLLIAKSGVVYWKQLVVQKHMKIWDDRQVDVECEMSINPVPKRQ